MVGWLSKPTFSRPLSLNFAYITKTRELATQTTLAIYNVDVLKTITDGERNSLML